MKLENIVVKTIVVATLATAFSRGVYAFPNDTDLREHFGEQKKQQTVTAQEGTRQFFGWTDSYGAQHVSVLTETPETVQLEEFSDGNSDCVPDQYKKTWYRSASRKHKQLNCTSIVGSLAADNIRAEGGFCPVGYIRRTYQQYAKLLGYNCRRK